MQDTPLKPFRPTAKVVPFNYHSIADALHFDVMSPGGWPKRKWSRGSNKLLLQEEGTITGMSLDIWIDWVHHISCAIFTTSVQKTSHNFISKPLVRPALPTAHLFSWKSSTSKMGTADSSRTSIPSYQTIRRHIPEESNLHNPQSSATMTSSHRLSCKLFPFHKNFPVEIFYDFLCPNYMPSTP